jgi:hypothetical protein
MKRWWIGVVALVVLGLVAESADAAHRRRSRGNRHYGGLSSGIQLYYGYAPSYGYGLSNYGYVSPNYGFGYGPGIYGSGIPHAAYGYDPILPGHCLPRYDYTSDPFGGSPSGGNSWYWLTQQAANGNISWTELNEQMYLNR